LFESGIDLEQKNGGSFLFVERQFLLSSSLQNSKE
jgi:hypothetical protein